MLSNKTEMSRFNVDFFANIFIKITVVVWVIRYLSKDIVGHLYLLRFLEINIKIYRLLFSENISVTEREVINGILDVKNTKNHCLAYVRIINNINLQNLKKASLFIDILNRSLDTEAIKLLADLRDERLTAKIETANFQK